MKNCFSCGRSTRRQWLAGFGASAAFQAAMQSGDAQVTTFDVTPRNTARTCIFINLEGGPSHLDTFDVKDAAWNPGDLDFQRHTGGLVLSRTLFPQLSRLDGDLLVLRSVSSWESGHERGQFYLVTAHPPNPAFAPEIPAIGAVAAFESRAAGRLPKFMALNGRAGQGATFLGGRFEPLTGASLSGGSGAGLGALQHPDYGAQGQARFEQKYRLLQQMESAQRDGFLDPPVANHVSLYDSAKQMMYDPVIASAFQYTASDDRRYGSSDFGRACLVARNAVQARQGVAFISIRLGGWDTHQRMFDRAYFPNMYDACGTLDLGVGMLAADLKAANLLNETLIVVMGEFGRTPGPLNSRGGRDHHADAMSVLMIGGGARGGRIIGATDNNGARIVDPGWKGQRPIYVEDLCATIYSALGINWTKRITDTPTGRVFEYVGGASRGTYLPVDEVFG